jgi:hypothetical protein
MALFESEAEELSFRDRPEANRQVTIAPAVRCGQCYRPDYRRIVRTTADQR